VAVVGPHLALTCFLGRSKVHGVSSPDEEVLWRGQHQCARPPQHSFSDGYEIPQTVSNMIGKARGQGSSVGLRARIFPHSAVEHCMKLG